MLDLGHSFADPSRLTTALTHASCDGAASNERLEFLGDAVLDAIVAQALFAREPGWGEGRMTRLKADVVSRRSLALPARRLELAEHARLGPGLRGRSASTAVLANLYEAVVGAIFVDGGFEAARAFVLRTLAAELDLALSDSAQDNPKQRFQELCQSRWGSLPAYRLLETRGPPHARAFKIVAQVDERSFPAGWGRTVKEAEGWAAHEALLVCETAG